MGVYHDLERNKTGTMFFLKKPSLVTFGLCPIVELNNVSFKIHCMDLAPCD